MSKEEGMMGPLFSNISPQLKAIFKEQSGKPLSLRQGQVMLGKIKEILPNNVAVVQFGKHQVTAKLEVPINLDQPYLFEVISVGEIPQLRVLTESNSNQSISGQLEQILANLNLNPTREQRQFINEVINNQIPFRQTDLKQALDIYKNNQTQASKEQLIGMLQKQLPITGVTFDAIKAVSSNQSLSEQIDILYQAIENQPIHNETTETLLETLSVMLDKGSNQPVTASESNQAIGNLNQLFQNSSNSQTQLTSNSTQNQTEPLDLNPQSIVDQLTQQLGLTNRQIYQLNKVLTLKEDQPTHVMQKTVDHLQHVLTNQSIGTKLAQHLPLKQLNR